MENTKENSQNKDDKPKIKKLPVWHEQQELILKNWSEIGSSYRYLHDKSFMKYNSQNLRFALPVIVISTITGTANFAQKSFPESWTTYVPLGIGFLNLTAGLITTIALVILGPTIWVEIFGFEKAIFPYKYPALFTVTISFLSIIFISLKDKNSRKIENVKKFDKLTREAYLGKK